MAIFTVLGQLDQFGQIKQQQQIPKEVLIGLYVYTVVCMDKLHMYINY